MWVVLKDPDVLKQLPSGDSWETQYNSYMLFCPNLMKSRGENTKFCIGQDGVAQCGTNTKTLQRIEKRTNL